MKKNVEFSAPFCHLSVYKKVKAAIPPKQYNDTTQKEPLISQGFFAQTITLN
ncbi:hypothetical protein [Vagococcus salmoninarum]|uniref:hypothetical protein n=1 Tax=Vagococcus salmoninarum TaxID=2739 RepID=UPI001881C052|nr:hypothetical protein [Vagococcus salmoninarum]MBE9387931.1 hypothetical protein [Vagococcus salmoninarum]